ncbi:SDR family oxidoreductase [Frondihabitans cladoniiphilus]|uniref:SDR family oxidoreductase n=1 Tax=Frondihabitans cladoniiphilus TaxID=715785 RepID=A0ABP8W585_9MICO
MKIAGSTALVTGANRGLGVAFVAELLARGAKRVYCAAREPLEYDDARLVPLRLDVTDPEQVAAAAAQAPDVDLLVNNAGIMLLAPLVGAPTLDDARREMEVNYFGTLSMVRAFAPVLRANGGGAVVNMLSVASWFTPPASGSYGASKSAAWALTNGVRVELRGQGTQVVGVHAGFIDTDMARKIKVKISPETVAEQTFDGVEAGAEEVLADAQSREVKQSLPRDLELLYPAIQARWDARATPRATP